MRELQHSPTDYWEWLDVFRILENRSLRADEWELLCKGTIYDFDHVQKQFLETLEKTVNTKLKNTIQRSTKALNIGLEDGDYVSLQIMLRRAKRELNECRFCRELTFLPEEIICDLDRQVVETIRSYWNEWINTMKETAMEMEQEETFNMLYYLRRMEREYGKL
ncbi:MAG: hypothetical protein Q4B22_09480 [Eubacteriales bacterium]|nr:hypothetical protein [Eubacteriales bacterium]